MTYQSLFFMCLGCNILLFFMLMKTMYDRAKFNEKFKKKLDEIIIKEIRETMKDDGCINTDREIWREDE